ncbi:ABC transporter substrate-binding protein [Shewanella carassii]|nr:ABC transporter substrate-binding protein [Shewanella carassii]
MDRRCFIKGSMGLGLLACYPWLVHASVLSPTAQESLPQARDIKRVVSAGGPADLLLLALSPEKLLGYAHLKPDLLQQYGFASNLWQKPRLGRLVGRNASLSLEKLMTLDADLVVDYGNVSQNYQSMAQKVERVSGVPFLLLDGSLADIPLQLKKLGQILGVHERADFLAKRTAEILSDAREFGLSLGEARSFYFGRGANGLETGVTGSIHTEAIEQLGLKNVAQAGDYRGLAKVSLEQLMAWEPEIIISQDPEFIRHIHRDPVWGTLAAVRNQRIYWLPNRPFGWIDTPPGINRLLGMSYLRLLLSGADERAQQALVKDFYRDFYHSELSGEQAANLLRPE